LEANFLHRFFDGVIVEAANDYGAGPWWRKEPQRTGGKKTLVVYGPNSI
jgi:hypothetical protein